MRIDKTDLRAMRKADSAVLYTGPNGPTIKLFLDLDRIHTAATQRLFPDNSDITRARVRIIGASDVSGDETAFAHVSSARYANVWQSIVTVLRPNDDIVPVFYADYYSNQYAESANLHVDVCRLRVNRTHVIRGRDVTKTLEFDLSITVCPSNSARMIRKVTA